MAKTAAYRVVDPRTPAERGESTPDGETERAPAPAPAPSPRKPSRSTAAKAFVTNPRPPAIPGNASPTPLDKLPSRDAYVPGKGPPILSVSPSKDPVSVSSQSQPGGHPAPLVDPEKNRPDYPGRLGPSVK